MFLRNALRRVPFFVIGTLMCGFHGENLNSMTNELSVRAWKLPFAVEFNPSAGEGFRLRIHPKKTAVLIHR